DGDSPDSQGARDHRRRPGCAEGESGRGMLRRADQPAGARLDSPHSSEHHGLSGQELRRAAHESGRLSCVVSGFSDLPCHSPLLRLSLCSIRAVGADMTHKRKIIVHIATSADGYIARPDGNLDWLTRRPAPKGFYGLPAFTRTVDAKIIGRKTFDLSVKLGAPFSANSVHYVFSRQ